MFGPIADNTLAICDGGEATSTTIALRKQKKTQLPDAALHTGGRGKLPSFELLFLEPCKRGTPRR
jgi:hypothetical protein